MTSTSGSMDGHPSIEIAASTEGSPFFHGRAGKRCAVGNARVVPPCPRMSLVPVLGLVSSSPSQFPGSGRDNCAPASGICPLSLLREALEWQHGRKSPTLDFVRIANMGRDGKVSHSMAAMVLTQMVAAHASRRNRKGTPGQCWR